MFESFGAFTAVFSSLTGLLLLGIIFKEPIFALEDKFDAWVDRKKEERKNK